MSSARNNDVASTLIRSTSAATWITHSNLAMTSHRNPAVGQRHQVGSVSGAAIYNMRPQWQLVNDLALSQADEQKLGSAVITHVLGVTYLFSKRLGLDTGLKHLRHHGEIERQLGAGLAWRY